MRKQTRLFHLLENVRESRHVSSDLQREGLKELRRSKGKLNPSKVFKMLHHRAAASVKHPPGKRS